jgi:hypothetical protein
VNGLSRERLINNVPANPNLQHAPVEVGIKVPANISLQHSSVEVGIKIPANISL